MKTYKCWDADNSDEDNARSVKADNWAEAAGKFAEREYSSEPYESMEVHVRTPDGALYSASVDVEHDVSFCLSLKQKLELGLDRAEVKP